MGHAETNAPWPAFGPPQPGRAERFSLLDALVASDFSRETLLVRDTAGEPARELPWASGTAVTDVLAEQIAYLDREGTILAVNKAWKDSARLGTTCGLVEGDSYRQSCLDRADQGDPDSLAIVGAWREMEGRTLSQFDHLDRSDCPRTGRIYSVRISLLPANAPYWAVLARYDVTQLMALRRQKRRLSSLLLNAEAEERRRVARDLHDSTAQDLVALQLSLSQLKRAKSAAAVQAFADIDCALERLQREIRALSYLFHAPTLDEGGLSAALETMAIGFGRRAGLEINLSLDSVTETESKVAGALYRLAQEALANIQRHAGATAVEIRLLKTERRIHFMVRDNGKGLRRGSDHAAPAVGVGLASMQERISEIGGCLVIRYSDHGTSIVASVPVVEADPI